MNDVCDICYIGHHQGCGDTTRGEKGPHTCKCPCRPIEWRK